MSHQMNQIPSGQPITVLPAVRINFQFELEHTNMGCNNNRGPLAVQASIDAMAKVEVTSEAGPSECSICLEGLKVGCEAKEMPICKHRFHSVCIETWLLRHASCPLCRSTMPILEEDQDNDRNSVYQADNRNSILNIDVLETMF
ncbi:hypothetical protein ACLB2K_061772 [Fragaria x ananassa]